MLAEAQIALRSEGIKEILDGFKAMSESMREAQKAMEDIRDAINEPLRQMTLFGEETTKSMDTAKDSIDSVKDVIDTLTESMEGNIKVLSDTLKQPMVDMENQAKESADKANQSLQTITAPSGGALTASVAIGTIIAEAIIGAVNKGVDYARAMLKAGVDFESAKMKVMAAGRLEDSSRRQSEYIKFEQNALPGYSPDKMADLYNQVSASFKKSPYADRAELANYMQKAAKVHNVDPVALFKNIAGIAAQEAPGNEAKQMALTKEIMAQMDTAAAGGKMGFMDFLENSKYMLTMTRGRGWGREEVLSGMNVFNDPNFAMFMERFTGSPVQIKDFGKTFNDYLAASGGGGIGYFNDEMMKNLDKAIKASKGDSERLKALHEKKQSWEEWNKQYFEHAKKTIDESTSGPGGLLQAEEMMRKAYESHIIRARMKNPQGDMETWRAKALKEMEQDYGLVGRYGSRFRAVLQKVLASSLQKREEDVQRLKQAKDHDPITGWTDSSGNRVKGKFDIYAQTGKHYMEAWEKSVGELQEALGRGIMEPLKEVLGPWLKGASADADKLREAVSEIIPKLTEGAKAFADAMGFNTEGHTFAGLVTDMITSLKDTDFKKLGTELATELKSIASDLRAIGRVFRDIVYLVGGHKKEVEPDKYDKIYPKPDLMGRGPAVSEYLKENKLPLLKKEQEKDSDIEVKEFNRLERAERERVMLDEFNRINAPQRDVTLKVNVYNDGKLSTQHEEKLPLESNSPSAAVHNTNNDGVSQPRSPLFGGR